MDAPWWNLLRDVSQDLSERLNVVQAVDRLHGVSDLEAAFSHPDAGGCAQTDINHYLMELMDVMMLCGHKIDESDVLRGVHHFSTADPELPFSTRTWRPILVTSMLAALQVQLREQSSPVKEQLRQGVSYWWPKHKADHAYALFTSRLIFKRALLSSPDQAAWQIGSERSSLFDDEESDGDTEDICEMWI